jgi:hypothetical protein
LIFTKIKNIGLGFIWTIYNYFYRINGSQPLSIMLATVIIIVLIVALAIFGIIFNIIGLAFPFIGAWLFVLMMIAAVLFMIAIAGGGYK